MGRGSFRCTSRSTQQLRRVRQSDCRLHVQVSDKSTCIGTDYRSYNFDPAMMHRGWNILQCLNNEVKITSGQYGVVGTTYGSAWSENSAVGGPDMVVRSVTIRVLATAAPTLPTPVWLGNVSVSAPWMGDGSNHVERDDVPSRFTSWRFQFSKNSVLDGLAIA
jgi:hypothetical protein